MQGGEVPGLRDSEVEAGPRGSTGGEVPGLRTLGGRGDPGGQDVESGIPGAPRV